jgi:hypothetical protein
MNRYIVVLFVAAAFSEPVRAADPVQDSIDWLLSLHLVELPADDEPFVRVVTGMTQREGQPAEVTYGLGFLESDDGTHYTVHYLGGTRVDADRGRSMQYGIPRQDEIRKLIGAEAVKFWCDRLEGLLKPYPHSRIYGVVAPVGEVIYLAAVLQKRGELEAAETLLLRAKEMFPSDWPKDEYLMESAKKQLGETLLRSVIAAFSDVKVPRKELEERLSQITQHFGGTKFSKDAETMLGPLRQAIVQEEVILKSGLDDGAIAKLPAKERVAALIQRLPNQTGSQMTIPGWCDIFYWERILWIPPEPGRPAPRANTPAGKLYERGWDAVPQLIQVLEDRRRALGEHTRCGRVRAPDP